MLAETESLSDTDAGTKADVDTLADMVPIADALTGGVTLGVAEALLEPDAVGEPEPVASADGEGDLLSEDVGVIVHVTDEAPLKEGDAVVKADTLADCEAVQEAVEVSMLEAAADTDIDELAL